MKRKSLSESLARSREGSGEQISLSLISVRLFCYLFCVYHGPCRPRLLVGLLNKS